MCETRKRVVLKAGGALTRDALSGRSSSDRHLLVEHGVLVRVLFLHLSLPPKSRKQML